MNQISVGQHMNQRLVLRATGCCGRQEDNTDTRSMEDFCVGTYISVDKMDATSMMGDDLGKKKSEQENE